MKTEEIAKTVEQIYGLRSLLTIYGKTIVIIPNLKDLVMRHSPIHDVIELEGTAYEVIELIEWKTRLVNLDVPTFYNFHTKLIYFSEDFFCPLEEFRNKLVELESKNINWFVAAGLEKHKELLDKVYQTDDRADAMHKYNRRRLEMLTEISYYLSNQAFFLTEPQKSVVTEIHEKYMSLPTVKAMVRQCRDNIGQLYKNLDIYCDGDTIIEFREYLDALVYTAILNYSEEKSILALI